MAHASEIRWDNLSRRMSNAVIATTEAIQNGEQQYEFFQAIYEYANSSDQELADQLFEASPATTDQVAMVTDMREAITAAHELYSVMMGVNVAQSDKGAKMRRMGLK